MVVPRDGRSALLALAALDYLYQRSRLEGELRMTPQELREEMREMQGDPQIAARRRDLVRRRVTAARREPERASTPSATAERLPLRPAQIGPVDSIR